MPDITHFSIVREAFYLYFFLYALFVFNGCARNEWLWHVFIQLDLHEREAHLCDGRCKLEDGFIDK